MEFNIEREEFVKGLYRAQSVVEKKGTMPILLNVLIEAEEKEISITATDLEVGLRGFHPAEVKKEGKSTLLAKKLYEIVKELPEKKVSLRVKENQWVEISSGKSVFTMMGLGAENFPSLPAETEDDYFAAEAETLKEMIAKTIFAVSSDESRYNLTGVLFSKGEGEGKNLRMVATDGYRLSMIERTFAEEFQGLEKGILLPRKGLAELGKVLDEGGEKIGIKVQANNFIIRRDRLLLIMRLLDAEFPDYRQVIPLRAKRHMGAKRNEMLDALRRVSILSSEKTKGVKFHFGPDLLELSSYNPELGEAKEEVGVDYKGEEMVVGFNARFVLEVLGAMTSDEVVFEMEDGVSQAIIRPSNDAQHTCVVMPMRI